MEQTSEKARAARNEYMRRYRQTPQGAEKIKEAQTRYWARKYDALMEQDAQKKSNERKRGRKNG